MTGKILAFSGGIGGAKLALGLSHIVAPENLTIVCNTGDDFEHLGLTICPDIDTVLYTLANLANPQTGWGRIDETWSFMQTLATLGGPTWFQLGDNDLALHVHRTQRLRAGETLSAITQDVAKSFGLRLQLLPASNNPVRTRLHTNEGWLDFQDYFVARRCTPIVKSLDYTGANTAHPHPDLLTLLADPTLRAVILCPSNPFLSIEPMLAIPALRSALRATTAQVIAVSPIIGGRAIKGPTAKMMQELGLQVSALTTAQRYADFLNLYVLDSKDAALAGALPIPTLITQTLMTTLEDKIALARAILDAA
jgi:LPPG:FO 2-phospho-L-lactate transferase